MPCVHEKKNREYETYVAENRRDVNEFEGISDLVEVLKIVHRDREYDPLINWIPHPTPVDQLYQQLSDSDQAQLMAYVAGIIGDETKGDEAEDIVRCLAAFTSADLTLCQRALIQQNSFWPDIAFVRATEETRDLLIDLLDTDVGKRERIVHCLTRIGDPVVVDLFKLWLSTPPDWQDELLVHPSTISRHGGWEIQAGARQNLYFDHCISLVPCALNTSRQISTVVERPEPCPWCETPLVNLVEISLPDLRITIPGLVYVEVVTCEVCTCYTYIYGELSDQGQGKWAPGNARPEYLPERTEAIDPLDLLP